MKVSIPDLEAPKERTSFDPLAQDVGPEGYADSARFALVGEAPGREEMREGRPFVGDAGRLLDRILGIIDLPRYSLYITNFCKTKLPDNKTSSLWTAKGYRCDGFYELQRRLIDELVACDAKTIILVGETPMIALIDHPRWDKITKFRGSIYHAEEFPQLRGRLTGRYLALTRHPAAALPQNDPTQFYVIMHDLQKFTTFDQDPSVLDQTVTIHTEQPYPRCIEFMNEVRESAAPTCFDIECTPGFPTCFALSLGQREAMSIPLMNNQGNVFAPKEELSIWLELARVLENDAVPKIAQNGMFDFMYLLRRMGIKVSNFWFDTMIAQHIAWTDLRKRLEDLCSFYTWFPYYKDESEMSHLAAIKDWSMYYRYNAKDAITTHCCVEPLIAELERIGGMDAFLWSMALHKPLMEMEHRGMLIDVQGVREHRAQLVSERDEMQEQLNRLAGRELNVKSPKLSSFFYDELGYRPYINKYTKRYRCDDKALAGLIHKGSQEARLVWEIRKRRTLLERYFKDLHDPDHRIRCNHKITGTKTGRISTAETYFGTGTNLQNQPQTFRKYILADPDYLMVEADEAKAEAHVVAYLCQDEAMIQEFESGIDVHSAVAASVFHVPVEEVTKFQRQLGKKTRHAKNYGMGPYTAQENWTKEDIFMSYREVKALLDGYDARYPGLQRWHKEIEDTIYRKRVLYNLYGRPKRFLGVINTSMFLSAYAYGPQSTVGEIMNRGLVKLSQDSELSMLQLLTTTHDSKLSQVHRTHWGNLLAIMHRLHDHLSATFTYRGRTFTIAIDFKIGFNWGEDMIELPSVDQAGLDAAMHKLGISAS